MLAAGYTSLIMLALHFPNHVTGYTSLIMLAARYTSLI